METKAALYGVSRDFKTNKPIISFIVDSFHPETDLSGYLRLTVRRWREKRSLDANSYYWLLNSKLAVYYDTTPDELYELHMQRYGLLDSDDEGHISITVRSMVDMSRIDGHWKFVKASQDGKWKSYIRIRGTSEYDSKEMAYFLERVIEECHEAGISTETPNKILEAERWLKK